MALRNEMLRPRVTGTTLVTKLYTVEALDLTFLKFSLRAFIIPKTSWSKDASSTSSTSNILDNGRWNVDRDIFGSTLCRVEYDSATNLPTLELPSVVFVKKYYYDRSWWKENNEFALNEIPERDDYYEMFFNELKLNQMIAESQYASNYPKLLCSGYWNGLGNHLIHIFEYLGEELPEQEWDKRKVYQTIKDRLKEHIF
ncbi:uncharacterized protein RJT20DRAFT_148198 [Scheffersomyces xylosifermentans]|uniref:uncharacterized protein n=1 Tax=Scheffersomyces xylosifermentans TaxID=1304137 RepID=UPI00315C700D